MKDFYHFVAERAQNAYILDASASLFTYNIDMNEQYVVDVIVMMMDRRPMNNENPFFSFFLSIHEWISKVNM